MTDEEIRKMGVVPWSEIDKELNRLREHMTAEGYYSDYDFKITFEIFDDGVISLMLVDRTKGFQHHVYHFDFVWDEEQRKYLGKRVKAS